MHGCTQGGRRALYEHSMSFDCGISALGCKKICWAARVPVDHGTTKNAQCAQTDQQFDNKTTLGLQRERRTFERNCDAMRIVLLLLCAALCSAFRAPTALRRAGAPSVVGRSCVYMSDPAPSLKFNEGPEGIDDAPVLSKEDAFEVAMGRMDIDGAVVTEVVEKAPKVELRPESELTEEELKNRRKMEAVKKYAPWMADSFSPEAIAQREAAEAQRKDRKVEKLVGNRIDPAKQEISGTGLKIRVSSADEGGNVQLEWSTGSEEGNLGFIVSRKGPSDTGFVDIADYEKFQSLRSKGAAGGQYSFLDEDVPAGSYLYKVMDVAVGSKFLTEVCRKGVEVETKSEQTSTIALVAGFAGVAAVIFAITNMLDPQ